jgi:hypothetical protein
VLLTAFSSSPAAASARRRLDAIRVAASCASPLNLPTCYYLAEHGRSRVRARRRLRGAARGEAHRTRWRTSARCGVKPRPPIAAASLTNNPEWIRVADAAQVYARIPCSWCTSATACGHGKRCSSNPRGLAVRAERRSDPNACAAPCAKEVEETASSAADPVEDDAGEAQYAIVDAREFPSPGTSTLTCTWVPPPEERPVQWMVRRDASGLLASVNAFFRDLQSWPARAAASQSQRHLFEYEESQFREHVAERPPHYRAWFEKAAVETPDKWLPQRSATRNRNGSAHAMDEGTR